MPNAKPLPLLYIEAVSTGLIGIPDSPKSKAFENYTLLTLAKLTEQGYQMLVQISLVNLGVQLCH